MIKRSLFNPKESDCTFLTDAIPLGRTSGVLLPTVRCKCNHLIVGIVYTAIFVSCTVAVFVCVSACMVNVCLWVQSLFVIKKNVCRKKV